VAEEKRSSANLASRCNRKPGAGELPALGAGQPRPSGCIVQHLVPRRVPP